MVRTVQVTFKVDEPGPAPACFSGDLSNPDNVIKTIVAGLLEGALLATCLDETPDGRFCWAKNVVTGKPKYISIEGVEVEPKAE